MSRRAMVEPRWLDNMLMSWGRTLPGARGWYSTCPMLQSGIPASRPSYEPWDLQPRDFDDLVKAIDALDHKHRCVIYLTYKPWTKDEMEFQLSRYGVHQRTHQRWLHDAAEALSGAMSECGFSDIDRRVVCR